MEVIIGRENSPTPRLCIETGGTVRYYGAPGSVPANVSRKHCRISVGPGGSMTVANLSPANVTYVNGREYEAKSVTVNDVIELGPSRYRLDMLMLQSVLFPQAPRPGQHVPPRPAAPAQGNVIRQEYTLAPLERVWDEYEKAKLDIQISERRINAFSGITGILSMVGMICAFIPGLGTARVVMVVISLMVMIFMLVKRMSSVKEIPLKQRELDKKFHREYVCPNPNCRHFLGNQPYEDIAKNTMCPWCKAKYNTWMYR